MAHKTLSQISKTTLFEIVEYVHRHHGLLPYYRGNLAPTLQNAKIIENFTVYGTTGDKSVVAELSEDQLLCLKYYRRINNGNTLKRFAWMMLLNIFHSERVKKVHEQCKELEKELSGKK